MLFPIRPFFLERSRTIADLDPTRGPVVAQASVFHVAQIFALGDGTLAKSVFFNRLEQVSFPTPPDPCTNQIAHKSILCFVGPGFRGGMAPRALRTGDSAQSIWKTVVYFRLRLRPTSPRGNR